MRRLFDHIDLRDCPINPIPSRSRCDSGPKLICSRHRTLRVRLGSQADFISRNKASFTRKRFIGQSLRVRNLEKAKTFYAAFLPAIGFTEYSETPIGIAYGSTSDHLKPEFIGIIEDPSHHSNATRIAFWLDSKEELDRVAKIINANGALKIEGPMFCPEYSPTYYALFIEDTCGNRFEICSR